MPFFVLPKPGRFPEFPSNTQNRGAVFTGRSFFSAVCSLSRVNLFYPRLSGKYLQAFCHLDKIIMLRTFSIGLLITIFIGCGGHDISTGADQAVYIGKIERIDPRLDALIPIDARPELLADGFDWTEGPVWRRQGGYLLFNDIPANTLYQWSEAEGLRVFLRPAGFAGSNPPGRELGANGLEFDVDGRLILCDHGNRSVSRLDETNFTKTVLADRYRGKRLNSPNDLVIKSNGDVYFTDPPYGLRGLNDDPNKELAFNGVYRLNASGELTLLVDDLTFPNGIAFSPDERLLYVSNSDPAHAVWMVYHVTDDGLLADGRVFFDATPLVSPENPGLPDGMALDIVGNIFGAGPGGVLVFAPDGTHLGTIATGHPTGNVTFGDDGSSLFITSDMYLLRLKSSTMGPGIQ